MKSVVYSANALRDRRKYANMAGRLDKALSEYASGDGAHANNVKQLSGSSAKRLRVANFRVVFEETDDTVLVTSIGPRGSIYE